MAINEKTWTVVVLCLSFCLFWVTVAPAAEIKVMSVTALKAAVADLAESFDRETGHKIKFTYGNVGFLQQKIGAGERADIFILSDVAIDGLAKKGMVVDGTRTDLARIGIGVAVREGAPLPDISTPEALKNTLLSAKSLVYMDPAKGGTSAIHFAKVLEQLGIANALKTKTLLWPSGYAAEALVQGKAEICVHNISEILAVKGVTLVGPLPRQVQKVTTYSGGLVAGSASLEAAKAFLQFLTSPRARAKFAAVGMDYKE